MRHLLITLALLSGLLVSHAQTTDLKALGLTTAAPALTARFKVSHSGQTGERSWYLFRDDQQIAVLKGEVDEIWHRDAQGRISFERVFHADRQAVDYSSGELATLGVQVDWSALATLIDARELASLKLVSQSGSGQARLMKLKGQFNGAQIEVDWLPAWQLPARIERHGKRERVRIRLMEQPSSAAPAAWPRPGDRSRDYLRFDAADFGDMDYEPVVRKSEAIDVRAGWRQAHRHD